MSASARHNITNVHYRIVPARPRRNETPTLVVEGTVNNQRILTTHPVTQPLLDALNRSDLTGLAHSILRNEYDLRTRLTD